MVTDLQAGMLVGRYRLEERIAQGGMGSVWSARDTRLERSVAIKMLPRILVTDPSAERRFEREARAMGRLQHPNVVSIYDVGSADPGTGEELPFLVMELIRGHSLDQLLKDGPLAPLRAARILEQIGRALGAAHEAGIVHRDLKPSNVMLSEDDHVKVLDFGLARLIHQDGHTPEDTLTTPGMVLGSCPYMAPEQALGQQVIPASDIFSCGAVLYETLAGRRAFDGATPMRVLQAVVRCEYESLAEVAPLTPPVLVRMVDRCLCKDAGERYQDGMELARTLCNLVDSGELSRTEPAAAITVDGDLGEAGEDGRWHRLVKAGGLVLAGIIVAAALGAGLVLPNLESKSPQPGTWAVTEVLVDADLGRPSWNPAGTELVLERRQRDRGEVVVVAANGGAPRLLLRGRDGESLQGPRYSPDGKALAVVAVRDGEPRVRVLSSLGGTAFAEIEAAEGPAWIDSSRLLFIRPGQEGSSLWSFDLDGSTESPVLDASPEGGWWAVEPRANGGCAALFGPDRERPSVVYFADDRWQAPVSWLVPHGWVSGMSWAPGGDALALSLDGTIAKLTGRELETVLPDLGELGEVSLSPDGSRLAAMQRTVEGDLISIDLDGRGWKCLACGLDGIGLGSEVAGTVVYDQLVGDRHRIALRPPGVEARWITGPSIDAVNPVLSPGGDRVASIVLDDGGAVLQVVGLDGKDGMAVAVGVAVNGRPSWSEDGKSLVVPAADGGSLIVVPSDRVDEPLLVGWEGAKRPVWDSSGRSIAFVVAGSGPRRGVWIAAGDGLKSPLQVGVQASPVVWAGDGSLFQLRWDGSWLEVWQANAPSWAWARRSRLDAGSQSTAQVDIEPLGIEAASGRLVARRQIKRSTLVVFAGLDPERWR